MMNMPHKFQFFSTVLILLLSLILVGSLLAMDPKSEMFDAAKKAYKRADAADAKTFSPEHFKRGIESLTDADEAFKKRKAKEDVQKHLDNAIRFFEIAIEKVRLAELNFKNCISARNDALEAEAPKFRPELWENAEKSLNNAARTLENGNLNSARKKSTKAEELYRLVELEAIKANYLDSANELIEKADKDNVDKRAKIAFDKAKSLTAQSEKLLIDNPYDTDEARQIAQEAKYEAKHAIYLSQYIEQSEKDKKTIEMMIGDAESAMQKIADAFDKKAYFDQGYDQAAFEIVSDILAQKQMIKSLKDDVMDKDQETIALKQQIAMLENKLGDMEGLNEVVEYQKQMREKYERVRDAFDQEEGEVLRLGEKVVLRLYGLSFPVGKAIIEPQNFGLLGKVINAFKEYPHAGITIEGHTDSRGSDDANLKLSTQRAEAVREYLLSAGEIAENQIIAVGHGESKPVASNETAKGREKNRRIDVIVHPEK